MFPKLFSFLKYNSAFVQVMLLTFILCTSQSYLPSPGVQYLYLQTFYSSPLDNNWYGSKLPDSMQLAQTVTAGVFSTQFTYNAYDRSNPNLILRYQFSQTGRWRILKRTQRLQTCSVIYQSQASMFGLLFLDLQEKQMRIIAKKSFAQVKAFLGDNSDSEITMIAKLTTLAEDCQGGVFNGAFYKIKPDFKSVQKVTLPTTQVNWAAKSITNDLIYVLSSGKKLYKYNSLTNKYDFKLSLPQTLSSTANIYRSFTTPSNLYIDDLTSIFVGSISKYQHKARMHFIQQKGDKLIFFSSGYFYGYSIGQDDYYYQPTSQFDQFFLFRKTLLGNGKLVDGFNVNFALQKTVKITIPEQIGFYADAADPNNKFAFARDYAAILSPTSIDSYQVINNKVVKFASIYFSDLPFLQYSKITNVFPDLTMRSTFWIVIEVSLSFSHREYYLFNFFNYYVTVRTQAPAITDLYGFVNRNGGGLNLYMVEPQSQDLQLYYFVQNDGVLTAFYYQQVRFGYKKTLYGYTDDIYALYTIIYGHSLQPLYGNLNGIIVYEIKDSIKYYGLVTFNSKYQSEYQSLSNIYGAFITQQSQFIISSSLKTISIDKKVFKYDGYQVLPIANTNFELIAIDGDLVYAATTQSLWKYNPILNSYQAVYKWPTNFPTADIKLIGYDHQSEGILVIAQTVIAGKTTVQGFAYSNRNSQFKILGSFSVNKFTDFSYVYSTTYRMFMITGTRLAKYQLNLWNINYNLRTDSSAIKRITLPIQEFIVDPTLMSYLLYDKYFYARQGPNGGNTASIYRHYVYGFENGFIPKLIFKNILTDTQAYTFERKPRFLNNGQKTYLINTYLGQSSNIYQVAPIQININSSNILDNKVSLLSAYILNNKVVLCSLGCDDCLNGICKSCKNGYLYSSHLQICNACPSGCKKCAPNLPNCLICYEGNFNYNGVCRPCMTTCTKCSTATTCDQYLPGIYGPNDLACKTNCIECTDGLTCDTCTLGYTYDPVRTQCISCSAYCSSCDYTNILQCTSCAKGLQMIDGKCTACPINCAYCSSGKCTKCIDGYNLNNDATECMLPCKLPCINCNIVNDAQVCTYCASPFTLTSGKCIIDASCNDQSTCSDCGIGSNLYLVDGKCLSCPLIPNCLQCNGFISGQCVLCERGYFLTPEVPDGQCLACSNECIACSSATICRICKPGYTILAPATTGMCIACKSPCDTCLGTPNQCLSCANGFKRLGWKCVTNQAVVFSLVFVAVKDVALIYLIMTDIINAILKALGQSTNKNFVMIVSIKLGSVVVSGTVQLPGKTASEVGSIINSNFVATSIGGYSVSPISLSLSIPHEDTMSTGAIAGIAVGVSIFVGIIVALIYYICRCRKAKQLAIHEVPPSSNVIQPNRQLVKIEPIEGIKSLNVTYLGA